MPRLVVALALLVASCGEPLGGLGDASHQFVYGDETSTTTTTQPPREAALRVNPADDLVWFNDLLGDGEGDPETVIRRVYLRAARGERFVQASRAEIAAALPGVEFPLLVPEGVTHVTSQLVYDIETGRLDFATSAAFGLWAGEPYINPRSETQLAVLRVGELTEGESLAETDVFSILVEGGRELSWVSDGYVYSLFCRTGIEEATCLTVADSLGSLSLTMVGS